MIHKILVASAIIGVSLLASAQPKNPPSAAIAPSSQERRLFSDDRSVSTIVKAIGKCDALRAQTMTDRPLIGQDHKGRISTIRMNNIDFVAEYATDDDIRPSAIVGLGARLKATAAKSEIRDFDQKALRARVELYRHVRKVCGLPPVASYFSDYIVQAYYQSDDEYPPWEWFDTGFWSEIWQPVYNEYLLSYYWQPKPPPQECFDTCSNKCEIADDVNGGGCLVAGALAADYFGVGGGIAVGLACTAGKTIGK